MASNDRSIMHSATGDFMDTIREHFFTDAAEPEPEPEFAPGITVEDVLDMGFEEFGERRVAMGIRHQASDILGLSSNDQASGMPDWREPPPAMVPEPSELDQHAETRQANGIPNLNDFGLPARTPRSNASPWSVVQ